MAAECTPEVASRSIIEVLNSLVLYVKRLIDSETQSFFVTAEVTFLWRFDFIFGISLMGQSRALGISSLASHTHSAYSAMRKGVWLARLTPRPCEIWEIPSR